jgi:hypothetical protein
MRTPEWGTILWVSLPAGLFLSQLLDLFAAWYVWLSPLKDGDV